MPVEQINNTTCTVTYLHHDQAGSTRLLTGSTGAVTGKCTYSAYGMPACECEGTTTTPLGYDIQYTNLDTELIYLRNRVYDPVTAQFTSRDPLASFTREPFGYAPLAEDNPLNVVDPTGLFSIGEIPVIGESLEKVGTRTVGFFDGFTEPVFGGTAALRSVLGLNGGLNECSAEYQTANEIGGYTLDAEAFVASTRYGVKGARLILAGFGSEGAAGDTVNPFTMLAESLPDAEFYKLASAGVLAVGPGAVSVLAVEVFKPATGNSTCKCT